MHKSRTTKLLHIHKTEQPHRQAALCMSIQHNKTSQASSTVHGSCPENNPVKPNPGNAKDWYCCWCTTTFAVINQLCNKMFWKTYPFFLFQTANYFTVKLFIWSHHHYSIIFVWSQYSLMIYLFSNYRTQSIHFKSERQDIYCMPLFRGYCHS